MKNDATARVVHELCDRNRAIETESTNRIDLRRADRSNGFQGVFAAPTFSMGRTARGLREGLVDKSVVRKGSRSAVASAPLELGSSGFDDDARNVVDMTIQLVTSEGRVVDEVVLRLVNARTNASA